MSLISYVAYGVSKFFKTKQMQSIAIFVASFVEIDSNNCLFLSILTSLHKLFHKS